MKIGILQTGHVPETLRGGMGNYPAFFERLLDGHGFTFENHAVVDGAFPSGPEAADAWLITGSRHGAYEDHDWIPPLEALIRDIHDSGRPMIGICFGHQIIAQALGGKVEKFEGGWSVGRVEYDTAKGPLAMNAWHQDQVTERPAGAQVLGSTAFCENAILAYGQDILTYQPHPEFEPEFIRGLIHSRGRGTVPDEQLDDALAQLEAPLDNPQVARDMAAFFKTRALPIPEAAA